tara:strand:+ start:1079 stop:1447 length:369 start_codon:yes stop_codon:yes gene_type:complete
MKILLLPFPPSVNALWRHARGRTYKTAKYTEWAADAQRHLLEQPKIKTITTPISVELAVGRPDKRKRDIDNIVKAVFDLLQNENVIEDDALIHDFRAYWSTDVVGVQVIIKDLVGQEIPISN